MFDFNAFFGVYVYFLFIGVPPASIFHMTQFVFVKVFRLTTLFRAAQGLELQILQVFC